MFIKGVGTAAPSRRYSQRECWETLQPSDRFAKLSPRARAILKKVLTGASGIEARRLSLERLEEAFDLTPDALHARFADNAPNYASEAGQRALEEAQESSDAIDALIISTCTGYLCPGLTSYVAERLGLRSDVLCLDLVGQGCVAALPNLRAAQALLSGGSCNRVLSICVEVCSAAFFLDDDPGVLISACLFGDGAGAAVLSPTPSAKRRIEWKTTGSILVPSERDLLRFEQKNGMLRNLLAPQVPALAAQHVAAVAEEVLAKSGLLRSQVAGWVLHPGGRDVLVAIQERLGLDHRALRWSEAVLREFGNVSSASLFFVLDAALRDSPPSGYWWMSSFGAGFSCHGALLEVE